MNTVALKDGFESNNLAYFCYIIFFLSVKDGASDTGSFIPPPSPDFSVLGSGATNNIYESRSRHKKPSVKALDEKDREASYMSTMKAERLRLARIQRARSAAEVIQRSWRRYKSGRR